MDINTLKIQAYLLGYYTHAAVVIARTPSPDGDRWAIRCGNDCLNRDGDWVYEPMPSHRTPAFLAHCRFASVEEALPAWELHLEKYPDDIPTEKP